MKRALPSMAGFRTYYQCFHYEYGDYRGFLQATCCRWSSSPRLTPVGVNYSSEKVSFFFILHSIARSFIREYRSSR